jgi:hypothetical protein
MARRFFFVCLGILCLVCAYQLGADRARADWDLTVPGQVVGGGPTNLGVWYTAAGEAWGIRVVGPQQYEWVRADGFDLPVPASEVKFLSSVENAGFIQVLTNDDVAYVLNWVAGEQWVEVGPFPGGPVPLRGDSWGGVKDRYRE